MRGRGVFTDHLLAWIVGGAALGVAFPALRALEGVSLGALAVMIGATALGMDVAHVRRVPPRAMLVVVAGHAAMIALALVLGLAFGLSDEARLGLLIVAAVTPELAAPVFTRVANGNAALTLVTIMLVGVLSLVTVPLAFVLGGEAPDATTLVPLLRTLVVSVVIPMGVALTVRSRWRPTIAKGDAWYPELAALMVVFVMVIVAASNAQLLRGADAALGVVAVAAGMLNLAGLALGWTGGRRLVREDRIAAVFSVGMRDFAVAAAIVLAAGLAPVAAVPAAAYGLIELVTASALARRLARRAET